MSAAGTAILIAAFLSALICGVGFGDVMKIAGKTLFDMRFPALTVASVLGLAYVMNASGMTNCLGLIFTKTGHWFPFIAPILGWLGVFLTGSDTSSNVLFGGLQKATAEQLGLNPILTGAANTSGGVMGKMISPQSLAVATAACGMVGEEGSLFRFEVEYAVIVGRNGLAIDDDSYEGNTHAAHAAYISMLAEVGNQMGVGNLQVAAIHGIQHHILMYQQRIRLINFVVSGSTQLGTVEHNIFKALSIRK